MNNPIKIAIPDNEGNRLVVALNYYDECDKLNEFNLPQQFLHIDIVDISIEKLYINRPIGMVAFNEMCRWLIDNFNKRPNTVFSFICSFDDLDTNHSALSPTIYRWRLFDFYYNRNKEVLASNGIFSRDLSVGPSGFENLGRIFYRTSEETIIHLIISHLTNKP